MRAAAFTLLLCGLGASASAQPSSGPAIERVIVTAPRIHSGVTPNAIAHDFVGSYAVPSVLTEQISRWGTEICPAVYGLAPRYTDVTEQRLRTIAMEANAPLKPKGCRPNLIVIFTSLPQVALDKVHARNVDYLGYHGATTISHPIQAWYVTATMDTRGGGAVDQDGFFTIDPFRGGVEGVAMASVGGWRARHDVSNDLLYVTVIVDSAKTAQYNLASVMDYVATLALSRSEDYGDCQLMPSITNLLSPNCDDKLKPSQISPTDIAYLRGVYKMDPGAKLIIQQDQIAAEMAKAIPAKAGP